MTDRREANQGQFENIPEEMRARSQWVVFKLEDRGDKRPDGTPKMSKCPYAPNGRKRKASSTDPATWGTFDQAVACLNAPKSPYSGIGYVFSADDPYTGVDLDNCCPTPGELEPWAAEIVELLGSYAEFSPSGTGVHIIVRGTKPDKKCKKVGYGGEGRDVEVYSAGRFFCTTGERLPDADTEIRERTAELATLWVRLFPPPPEKPGRKQSQTPAGDPSTIADQDLLSMASNAKNGDKFLRLWTGDTSGYDGDESDADMALCCMLAFWTDRDPQRIDRLFRQSGLFRAKWDREDYAQRTIEAALQHTTEGYRPGGGHSASPQRPAASADDTERMDAGEHLTDLGNAKRLVKRFGHILRFSFIENRWYHWNGVRWSHDDNGEIARLAKKTVLAIYGEAMSEDIGKERREQIAKHAHRSESASRIAAMIELAKSEPGIVITPEEFDADPNIRNVQNGILDLKTGRLLPHDSTHLCSKLTPVTFDPKAKAPLWKAFLERSMAGDEELIGYLQRVAGYCLTGDTSEECFWLFHGNGRNGKGVYTETMLRIQGDYGRQSESRTFMARDRNDNGAREDIADLVGVRLTTASEIDSGRRLDISLIKTVTGRDTVRCRRMHENGFTYRPQFKLIMSANHKPQIPDTSRALWDRVRLVPFEVYIPEEERDKKLKDKLLAELPGILLWALRGCLEWQKNGLQTPKAVLAATDSYQADEDILNEFLTARCVLSSVGKVSASALFESYLQWCEEAGEKPLGKATFRNRLLERGGIKTAKGAGNKAFWFGIALSSEGEI